MSEDSAEVALLKERLALTEKALDQANDRFDALRREKQAQDEKLSRALERIRQLEFGRGQKG